MPQWRKLHVKATESLDIDDMPNDFHRLLWIMLPLGLDSEGRGLNNPAWIKAKVMPLRTDVKAAKIKAAMNWYAERGMIEKYDIDGRSYFWIPTFTQYQGNTSREASSDYPPPPSYISQEEVTTNSRPTQEQVAQRSSTDVDSDVDSDSEEIQTTDTDASVVAVKILLADFGVEATWVSDLAMMCSEEKVKDWIAYVNGKDGITNPAGFLISRLRVGEEPPVEKKGRWFTGNDFKQYFVQPGEMPEEENDVSSQ